MEPEQQVSWEADNCHRRSQDINPRETRNCTQKEGTGARGAGAACCIWGLMHGAQQGHWTAAPWPHASSDWGQARTAQLLSFSPRRGHFQDLAPPASPR